MPGHHPPHGGGGHGHGHAPGPWFGNWGWSGPQYETVVVEQDIPDWLWIAGGALVGAVLALIVRD